MKKIFIAAVTLLFACTGFAQNNSNNAPLIIKEQGSFLTGGIKGNSHFLFAEKNNVVLADLLQKWIQENFKHQVLK